MSIDINYSMSVRIEGEKESECNTGTKGAGEAKRAFEKMIENAKFSASNTSIYTLSLTQD